MIPVYACIDGACILGWVWNPEQLSEFLGWWMPFNFSAYLMVGAWGSAKFGFSQKFWSFGQIASSMFITVPIMLLVAVVFVYEELFGKAHRRKRQLALDRANQKAYFSNKGA